MCRFKFLPILAVAVFFGIGWPAAIGATIKVFTIGNSFSNDATRFLPQLAKSQGIDIILGKANLGGADMARHLRHWRASLADPASEEGRPYRDSRTPASFSLVDGLQADTWDFVTIQQVSHRSFDPASYEPDATALIEIVRRFAPQAEIVVHQTWAYREDHAWFQTPVTASGTEATPPSSQREMHRELAAAYDRLAKNHRLRLLPVGDAFQRARQSEPWQFRFPDPAFAYDNPAPGTLPRQDGSLNVGWRWRQDQLTGLKNFVLDANHANAAGCYLGACVWFEVLAGRTLTNQAWRPEDLSAEQASSLQQTAHATLIAPLQR